MRIWLLAARPRTLPAAVAPVLVGTGYAVGRVDDVRWGAFVAAMLGAIFIQIGTNLSNDYSDARRGADTEERLGPVRVTAGGLVPPRSVLTATYVAFGLAVLCGVYLIAVAGWVVLAIGAASIIAGVLYTGGPRPYGYEGLGEVFVFLFFGIVAVSGSAYVQIEQFTWQALALAAPVGFLATAILVVNNLRDISTDSRAGKRTLAVRIGRERTRALYMALVYGAFLALIPLAAFITADVLVAAVALVPAVVVVAKVRTHSDGPTLNEALANTGELQLLFCVLLSAGLIIA
jgi:1,4-dihydroxy-2-naphthoate octaprenyltransferase